MRRLTVLLFLACLFSCQNDDNEKETQPEEKAYSGLLIKLISQIRTLMRRPNFV